MPYATPLDCLRWDVVDIWWLMDQIVILHKEAMEWQRDGNKDLSDMCGARANRLTEWVVPLMVQVLPQLPVSPVDASTALPTQAMFLGRLPPIWRETLSLAYANQYPERSSQEWFALWETQIRQDLIATDPGGGVGAFGIHGLDGIQDLVHGAAIAGMPEGGPYG